MEQELADKAVSAILSLLTFFLIAEKESKEVFTRLRSGHAFLVTFSLLLETKKK